jgi:hypothetical protein
MPEHRNRPIDARIHFHNPGVGPGGLAEREQLPRQPGGPVGGSNDLIDVVHQLGVARIGDTGQLGVATNCLKQVVEVVGDPAREVAERLHLLGLAQLAGADLQFLDQQGDLQGAAQAYAQGVVGEWFRGPHFEDGVAQRIVLEEERLHDHGVGAADWQQPIRQERHLGRDVAERTEGRRISSRIVGEDDARTSWRDVLIEHEVRVRYIEPQQALAQRLSERLEIERCTQYFGRLGQGSRAALDREAMLGLGVFDGLVNQDPRLAQQSFGSQAHGRVRCQARHQLVVQRGQRRLPRVARRSRAHRLLEERVDPCGKAGRGALQLSDEGVEQAFLPSLRNPVE